MRRGSGFALAGAGLCVGLLAGSGLRVAPEGRQGPAAQARPAPQASKPALRPAARRGAEPQARGESSPESAVLVRAEGEVGLRTRDGEFRAVRAGASLPAGAVVQTAGDGSGLILFPDGSRLEVGARTAVEVDGGPSPGARLLEGLVRVDSGGEGLRVMTAASYARVRGASFRVWADAPRAAEAERRAIPAVARRAPGLAPTVNGVRGRVDLSLEGRSRTLLNGVPVTVGSGAAIRSGKGSECVLTFGEGSEVRLFADSAVALDLPTLELYGGRLEAQMRGPFERLVEVRSAPAASVVQGSSFSVQVGPY